MLLRSCQQCNQWASGGVVAEVVVVDDSPIVVVVWSYNDRIGSAPTSYGVERVGGDGAVEERLHEDTSTSFDWIQSPSGQQQFRVRAQGIDGTVGPWSDLSGPVEVPEPPAPQATSPAAIGPPQAETTGDCTEAAPCTLAMSGLTPSAGRRPKHRSRNGGHGVSCHSPSSMRG